VMFPCFSMAFRKQTGPNIREHIIQIRLQSLQWTNIKKKKKKKTGKGSGHNEHHEKVNKHKPRAEKDT
jgi:hypothetical protein